MQALADTSTIDRHYYRVMTVVAIALGGICGLALVLPEPLSAAFLEEGGPVETMSAAGFVVCVVALFREGSGPFLRRHYYLVAILVAMALRELDFHSDYTTMSITRARFYLSPAVPLGEKLGAVAAVGFLAWCGLLMLRRFGRDFVAGIRRLDSVALAVALAAGSAILAKSLDGLPRKLSGFGIDLAADAQRMALALEEVVELGIPAFLLIAIFSYFLRARTIRPIRESR